ncbi:MAG: response regulator [Phycisphaeraceae bacterium]|nr:response regulator [Phycisphaeraceae bacterium]
MNTTTERTQSIIPGVSILVVDDEPDAVVEMVDIIEDMGYPVYSATNAFEAQEQIRTRPEIGIVITDIRMPGQDGFALADSITRSGRPIEIIGVSGHAGKAVFKKAIGSKFVDMLEKPLDPMTLTISVERARSQHVLRHDEKIEEIQAFDVMEAVTRRAKSVSRSLANLEGRLAVDRQTARNFVDQIAGDVQGISLPLSDLASGLDNGVLENQFVANEVQQISDQLLQYLDKLRSPASAESYLGMRWHSVTVSEILEAVISRLGKTVKERRTRLVYDIEHKLMTYDVNGGMQNLYVNKERFARGLYEVVENAVLYSPQSSEIKIAIRQEAPWIVISIHDTGVGMDEQMTAPALAPFTPLRPRLGQMLKSSGQGLAEASLMALMHGGKLTIEGTKGEGTTVTFWLPDSLRHDGGALNN